MGQQLLDCQFLSKNTCMIIHTKVGPKLCINKDVTPKISIRGTHCIFYRLNDKLRKWTVVECQASSLLGILETLGPGWGVARGPRQQASKVEKGNTGLPVGW